MVNFAAFFKCIYIFVKIITVIVTTFKNVYNCLFKILLFKHHPKVFIKLIIQQKN